MGSSGAVRPPPGSVWLGSTGYMGSTTASPATFNTISQAYAVLELRIYGRSTLAAIADTIYLRLNNDSGNNYWSQAVYGAAATAGGSEVLTTSYADLGSLTGASGAGGVFSSASIWFPGYSGTAAYKTMHGLNQLAWNVATGNAQMHARGAWWANTAGITRIDVGPLSGSWAAGSIVSLFAYTL